MRCPSCMAETRQTGAFARSRGHIAGIRRRMGELLRHRGV